jgi:RNA polymerase-binding transcription factor DksA
MSDVADEAQMLIEAAAQEQVAGIRAALAKRGEPACIGCGDEIEPERRAALPSARRCRLCQGRVEARAARGAGWLGVRA